MKLLFYSVGKIYKRRRNNMNSKGIVAIKNTKNLCYKCLQKKDKVHKISIGGSGYGSAFDNFRTSLQLCEDCYKESTKDKPIWNMKTVYGHDHFVGRYHYPSKNELDEDEIVDEYIDERYRYDDEMSEYLHNLPLQSRELVYNRNAQGACADWEMKAQDWIDYELDELSHRKCKQYGVYSPQERNAYEERFPNCACVVINKYKDGSQGSSCPYGAHGDRNGDVDLNIWKSCYMCSHYKPREGDIKVIDEVAEYYKNEKDRLIHMLQYASTRLRELENDVERYMDVHNS